MKAIWKNEKGDSIIVKILGDESAPSRTVLVQKETVHGNHGIFRVNPESLTYVAEEGKEPITIQGLIDWLSLLEPTHHICCYVPDGRIVTFSPTKHIDMDRTNKRLVIDCANPAE